MGEWTAASTTAVRAIAEADVDAGDLDVRVGHDVVPFGAGDGAEPTVEEWAARAETNPHEILTGIGARVPRVCLPVRQGESAWLNPGSGSRWSSAVAAASMRSPASRP